MTDHALVTSPRNPLVVSTAKLHQPRHRRTERLTIVEGPHQVADALAHGAVPHRIFVHADDDWMPPADLPGSTGGGAEIVRVNDAVLARLAGTDHPRGPVAVMEEPGPGTLAAAHTVVLHDVADPGNVGAVARTAVAFGWRVAVTPGGADPWSPKVVRASAAALFSDPPVHLGPDPVAELTAAGLTPLATVASGGRPLESIGAPGPYALLIGNEAHGLPASVVGECLPVTIPLDGGVESLNAAVAAGVCMYVLGR